jgi:tetratricopeptide (TPR) repeat protein
MGLQRARALAGEWKVVRYYATRALEAGDPAGARRELNNWLGKYPDEPNALTMLAQIETQDGQYVEAARLLQIAAEREPSPERLAMLASNLNMAFDAAAALEQIESLPEPLRDALEVRALQAMLVGSLGDHQRELAICEQLTVAHPDSPLGWKNYGTSLMLAGRAEEAVAAVRRAIDIYPGYGEAYWTLANFKSYRFSDDEIGAMQAQLGLELDDFHRLNFHFALGLAFEQRDDYEQAFAHFDAGNQLQATRIPPEQMYVTANVDSAIETLTPALFDRNRDTGFPSDEPIFVLGLYRSGSTLVEQILASHPMIEGTSELRVLPQLLQRLEQSASESGRTVLQEVARQGAKALHDLGAEYIELTRAHRRTDKPKFIDKLPANWLHAGLIRLALPNAKIIDARRHPLACGFSNFKQNYATGMVSSYSQHAIGTLYRDYLRMMQHMDRVQPGAVHRVINEQLIENFEDEVRRLLGFVGVPFDPACLEFHRNTRAVRTPSAEQVRRPINREGVDLWRHYEQWLEPMKQALGTALTDWDQPASA